MKIKTLIALLCPFLLLSCDCSENQAEREVIHQQSIKVPNCSYPMIVYTIVIDGEEYYMSYYDRSRTIWPKTKKPLEKPLK